MIKIENAQDIDANIKTIEIESNEDKQIDATGLIAIPGLIDPHVHFRTPGQEYKEDWRTASAAAIAGGYTTVIDMPNNIPACVTKERLDDKFDIIDAQLKEAAKPLRYHLYIGADRNNFDQIHRVRDDVVGIKVFMGSSTGDLLMDDASSLHAIFALARAHDLPVAVHAEDECMLQERAPLFKDSSDFADHSRHRTPEIAAKAASDAIFLAKMYGVRLYILHVSTINELEVIEQAKNDGVDVFAESCPHHLFLNTEAYAKLAGKAQMNPPLHDPEHQEALLAAVKSGLIDTLGSDHAPHTLDEKSKPFGQCPSGVPGIETNLPLLLDAVSRGDLTLKNVLSLSYYGPKRLFNLSENKDIVLIDMSKTQSISEAGYLTKCQWSPFSDSALQGWPVLTIASGQCFQLKK